MNEMTLNELVKLTTLWTAGPWINLADENLMIFMLFPPENKLWHFMQTVSLGDNLHEMSKHIFYQKKKKKSISKCHLLNFLPLE